MKSSKVAPHEVTEKSCRLGPSKQTPSAHAKHDHDREHVLRIFKSCDLNADGKLQKHELMLILQKLDPVGMTDTVLNKMMAEADVNVDGAIDVEEFLDWVWSDSGMHQEMFMNQASVAEESQLYEVSVITMTGEELAHLTMSPSDVIGDLKVKIREAGGPPKELQQLIFEESILTDDALLSSFCSNALQMTVHLVRLPRPPLLLRDFDQLVSANYASREQLVRALEDMFDGRKVDGQIREGKDMEDGEIVEDEEEDEGQGFVAEDNEEELKKYGIAEGTPLLCLAHQVATSEQLVTIASWLIAAGASIHTKKPAYSEFDATPSVIEEYFRLHKASLIQCVLDAGLKIPLSLSLIWLALPQDHQFKPNFAPPVSRSEWNFSGKMEDLKQTIDKTKELADYISMLRIKFLPALDLPADALARPLSRLGGGRRSACREKQSLLCQAIEDGCHAWALAELLRHGVQWEDLPDPPALEEGMIRPDCPTRAELLNAADELEAECSHVEASLCVAIWENDAAKVRKLLKQGIIDGWGGHQSSSCVSLILLAIGAGASHEIVDAILDDPQVDPNLGQYEYGWHGSFQLWSALGKVADEFLSGFVCVDLDTLDYVVNRLASNPRSDLNFGKLQRGERPRHVGRKACAIGSLLQTDSWANCRGYFGLLALLRAGAPLPMGMADPRISKNGGDWGYSLGSSDYESSDDTVQQSWFRHVVEDLESFLEDCHEYDEGVISHADGTFDPAELRDELAVARAAVESGSERWSSSFEHMQKATRGLLLCKNKAAADQLLPLLKRVMAGFRVEELTAFPIPDKLTARTLSRWHGCSAEIEFETEAVQFLPQRALHEVLSFLPLWASAWSRADHTRDLILGNVDVLRCSESGMPLRNADVRTLAFSDVLQEWWFGKQDEEVEDE